MKYQSMRISRSKAFTLVELLVVMVVVALLVTLALVGFNSVRAKARDARRVSDVKQMQTALELYFADEGYFPTNIVYAQPLTNESKTRTYMNRVPTPPAQADGPCANSPDYTYIKLENIKSYGIAFCLGGEISAVPQGDNIMTAVGIEEGKVASFIDAPVSGMDFVGSSFVGETNARGQFFYKSSDNVDFKVGQMNIGSIQSTDITDAKVFITDAVLGPGHRTETADPEVLNVSRALLSFDAGDDPTASIIIPSSLKYKATSSVDAKSTNAVALNSYFNSYIGVPATTKTDAEITALLDTSIGNVQQNICVPQSDFAFCIDNGATCGSVSNLDNCGTSRNVANCGSCGSGTTCGLCSGNPNRCGKTESLNWMNGECATSPTYSTGQWCAIHSSIFEYGSIDVYSSKPACCLTSSCYLMNICSCSYPTQKFYDYTPVHCQRCTVY